MGLTTWGECAGWQDSENRHDSICTTWALRTAQSPAAALPTTHTRSIRNSMISATAPSTVQTARRSISVWTGSRRTACGGGATGAPSSERKGTSKSARMGRGRWHGARRRQPCVPRQRPRRTVHQRDRGDGLPVLRRFDSGQPELHGKRDDAGVRLQGGGTVPDCAEAGGNGVSSEIMQESKPIGCL